MSISFSGTSFSFTICNSVVYTLSLLDLISECWFLLVSLWSSRTFFQFIFLQISILNYAMSICSWLLSLRTHREVLFNHASCVPWMTVHDQTRHLSVKWGFSTLNNVCSFLNNTHSSLNNTCSSLEIPWLFGATEAGNRTLDISRVKAMSSITSFVRTINSNTSQPMGDNCSCVAGSFFYLRLHVNI